jgi:hypothetical protein
MPFGMQDVALAVPATDVPAEAHWRRAFAKGFIESVPVWFLIAVYGIAATIAAARYHVSLWETIVGYLFLTLGSWWGAGKAMAWWLERQERWRLYERLTS